MHRSPGSKRKSSTAIRSAREEVEKRREEEWETEGGHMSSPSGRVALAHCRITLRDRPHPAG